MQEVRRAKDRGYGDHGRLKSFHSFSFVTTAIRSMWRSA
jgi:hypothetical protein